MIVQLSVHVMIAKVSENIGKCGPQEAVNFWKNGAFASLFEKWTACCGSYLQILSAT